MSKNKHFLFIKFIFLSFLFLLLLACSNPKIEQVDRAFYYWKSNQWGWHTEESSMVEKHQIKKIYVKFFEVDYSPAMGHFPISKTQMHLYGQDSLEIIPTVYLKNSVFLNASLGSLDTLADNVNFLINKFTEEKFSNQKAPKEIQMDCDWTLKSKDNYFYFLKKLKAFAQKDISCTLRLYPYKYADKMGVPPVDKVTLMCYNLLSPLQNHTKNTILDLQELESYLKGVGKYPKHVDVALPVYSWMQVYQNEQFSNVIYTNNQTVKKILKPLKPHWFTVTADTVVNETYLRIGDQVKFEEITADKIKQAIVILKKHIHFDQQTTVTLFHLGAQQLSIYSHEEIASFYTDFSQ